MPGWIELVSGTEVSFDLSYTMLLEVWSEV